MAVAIIFGLSGFVTALAVIALGSNRDNVLATTQTQTLTLTTPSSGFGIVALTHTVNVRVNVTGDANFDISTWGDLIHDPLPLPVAPPAAGQPTTVVREQVLMQRYSFQVGAGNELFAWQVSPNNASHNVFDPRDYGITLWLVRTHEFRWDAASQTWSSGDPSITLGTRTTTLTLSIRPEGSGGGTNPPGGGSGGGGEFDLDPGEIANATFRAINRIVQPILIALAGIGLLFAIYLGVKLATAQDESKRKEAKAQLVWAIIATVVVIGIVAVFAAIANGLGYVPQGGGGGETD